MAGRSMPPNFIDGREGKPQSSLPLTLRVGGHFATEMLVLLILSPVPESIACASLLEPPF